MVDLRALRAAVAAAMVVGPDGHQRAGGVGSAFAAVCQVCAGALPVTGAAFTAMASDQERELVYASDEVIARVQALQFSLGEGPALDAFQAGRPVCVPDLATVQAARWPILNPALAELPIGGLFTFPIGLGAIAIGVLDVYRVTAGPLSGEDLSTVLSVADLAAAALLGLRAAQPGLAGDGQLDAEGDSRVSEAWLDGAGSDRRVHQATGMLIFQLGVSAEEAFARLRAYAFTQDLPMGAVAEEIVGRRLRLDLRPD
jgi:GAF domain-containing protein